MRYMNIDAKDLKKCRLCLGAILRKTFGISKLFHNQSVVLIVKTIKCQNCSYNGLGSNGDIQSTKPVMTQFRVTCHRASIYIYLLLLISMLWHRQAIFESKGDKLSSSAESRIRTQGVSETQSSADWMPADKPTELSRIKLKNLNSTARPYDQQAFSPPDPTAIWHSHLALAIYRFVVVNFDALAQANDFRIERRQVVFLCWEQDSNPGGLWNPIFSRLNACWQTDWAIEDQAKKLELDSPSLWSASIQPTWPHCHLAFAPGSGV